MDEQIKVRNYNSEMDYEQVSNLYKDSQTFGGQYDSARDSEERLKKLSISKPDCILVAEIEGNIVGTVTLLEDGRTAWLFRFAVQKELKEKIVKELTSKALEILKGKGHTQVLVFAPSNNEYFEERYTKVGFNKGEDYTAYWQDI